MSFSRWMQLRGCQREAGTQVELTSEDARDRTLLAAQLRIDDVGVADPEVSRHGEKHGEEPAADEQRHFRPAWPEPPSPDFPGGPVGVCGEPRADGWTRGHVLTFSVRHLSRCSSVSSLTGTEAADTVGVNRFMSTPPYFGPDAGAVSTRRLNRQRILDVVRRFGTALARRSVQAHTAFAADDLGAGRGVDQRRRVAPRDRDRRVERRTSADPARVQCGLRHDRRSRHRPARFARGPG